MRLDRGDRGRGGRVFFGGGGRAIAIGVVPAAGTAVQGGRRLFPRRPAGGCWFGGRVAVGCGRPAVGGGTRGYVDACGLPKGAVAARGTALVALDLARLASPASRPGFAMRTLGVVGPGSLRLVWRRVLLGRAVPVGVHGSGF